MKEFLWHLLYITANCAVAIVVWENRERIKPLWQSSAVRERIKNRLDNL